MLNTTGVGRTAFITDDNLYAMGVPVRASARYFSKVVIDMVPESREQLDVLRDLLLTDDRVGIRVLGYARSLCGDKHANN